MIPVHIVRPLGKHEFIPAYSTEELLRGVCHLVRGPKRPEDRATEERVDRFMTVLGLGQKLGREVRQAKSRAKFDASKELIYEMLAKQRSLKHIANKAHMGEQALKKFLEEEGKWKSRY